MSCSSTNDVQALFFLPPQSKKQLVMGQWNRQVTKCTYTHENFKLLPLIYKAVLTK